MRPAVRLGDRRGLTLLEVLVAIAVFALGVTAVIALFPVGVSRMRQAVLDTRCTLLAQQAANVCKLEQIPDRLHSDYLNWGAMNILNPSDIFVNLTLDPATVTNAPRLVGYDAGSTVQELPTTFADTPKSFPVLIDPVFCATQSPPANRGSAITPSAPYQAIPIVTTNRSYALGASHAWRWFGSTDELQHDTKNPALPFNPSRIVTGTSTIGLNDYLVGSAAYTTAFRDYNYSWALMLQHSLGNYTGAECADHGFAADLNNAANWAILCFYRRNPLANVRVIEGCFFNNSRKVTLSWPIGAETPQIRRGTWICEASITGGKVSGTYAAAPNERRYRQAFHFYRIASVEPAQQLSTGSYSSSPRNYQVVELEGGTAGDYDRISSAGDARSPLPDVYATPTWPLSVTSPATFPLVDQVTFYPVLLFDGLEWVYQ